jgi:hypothetical protein
MHANELDRTQMRNCTSRSINAKISVGVLFPTAVLFWDLKKCQNRALPNPVDNYIATFVSISPLKLCYPTQSVVVNTALEIPHNTVISSSVKCRHPGFHRNPWRAPRCLVWGVMFRSHWWWVIAYSNQEDSLITDSQNPMEQSYTRLERLWLLVYKISIYCVSNR